MREIHKYETHPYPRGREALLLGFLAGSKMMQALFKTNDVQTVKPYKSISSLK